jgi:hypothetical protein
MMSETTERIYKLTVDSTQALNKLDQIAKSTGNTEAQFKKLNGTMGGLSDTIKKVGGAFLAFSASMAIVDKITGAFARATEEIDNLGKASQKVGVTVEALSALKFAGDQSGVAFDSLEGALAKFNKNLVNVGDTTSEVGATLRKFGVTTADTTETAFTKIANGFAKIPDSANKTAVAVELFGKAGADLIPLLNEGGDGLEAFRKRAEELGLVLSQDVVNRITAFNDSMSEMSKASEGITNQMVAGLAPALQSIATLFASSASAGEFWREVGRGIGEVLVYMAGKFDQAITQARQFLVIANATVDIAKKLGSADFGGAKNSFVDGYDSVKKLQAESDQRIKVLNQYADTFTATSKKIASVADSANMKPKSGGGGKTQAEKEAGAIEKQIEALKKSLDPLYAYQKAMEEINKLESAGLGADYANMARVESAKKLSDAMKKLTAEQVAYQESIDKEVKAINDSYAPFDALQDRIARLQELMEKGGLSADNYAKEVTKAYEIAQKKTDELAGKTDDSFQKLTDAMAGYTSSFVGSFIDDIGKAEFSFQNFAEGLLKTIAKLLANRMLTQFFDMLLKGTGSGSGGFSFFRGATPSLTPLEPSPTLSRDGSPAFTPMMVGMMKSAGSDSSLMGTTNIVVNNHNAQDNEVSTKETTNEKGQKQIEIFIEKKVKDMFGSGGMDKTMKSAYNLRRSPV